MTVLITLFTLLSLTVVYLVYTSTISRFIKSLALTLLTAFGIIAYDFYIDELGAPIKGEPQGEFVYVYHTIKGDNIYLWVWTEDRGERLHVFDYTQDTAEELAGAQAETDQGNPQQGVFPEPGGQVEEEAPVFDDWIGNTGSFSKE